MRKRTIIVVMGCMPAARQGLYIGESSELQTTYSAMAAYAMAWLLGTDNKTPPICLPRPATARQKIQPLATNGKTIEKEMKMKKRYP